MKFIQDYSSNSESDSEEDPLYCPEKYLSPPKRVRKERSFIKENQPQVLPHFCCGEHDDLLGEEFWSDEDDTYIAVDKGPSTSIVFLRQIPAEIAKLLEAAVSHRERGTQCEDTSSNLQTLANTKIISSGLKEITARIKSFETSHIPLLTLPKLSATIEQTILTALEGNQAFKCKLCCKSFSSGQALGGHTSRKHPGQTYGN